MTELPPFSNPPPDNPELAPIGDALPPPTESSHKDPGTGRWQGVRSLFAWIFRWALLGVGVGGVWFLGVLVAQFFPAPSPTPPLQEVVTRRTNRFIQKVRRLPSWWAGDTFRPRAPTALPRLPVEPTTPAPTTRPITLSETDREQVEIELAAIQEDLQRLRDRTSAVETQLGLPSLERPLEDRLGGVENRLSPPTETAQGAEIAPSTASETASDTPSAPPSDPLFQVEAYRVTLPGDVLFSPGQATLQTNAQPLLDSFLLDVGRYQGATILVGSYTDLQSGEGTAAELSYQQAIAVQQYLSQRLGNDSYHWVTVGYGNTSVGVTGSAPLSRRVTIAIVP